MAFCGKYSLCSEYDYPYMLILKVVFDDTTKIKNYNNDYFSFTNIKLFFIK